MQQSPLQRAIEKAGGSFSSLARAISKVGKPLTSEAVRQWSLPGRKIPVVRAVDIESAIGIPREELRPDVFSKEPSN
jgi:DNA-binding transcriptional regulator YdaS (Cro superfamily)